MRTAISRTRFALLPIMQVLSIVTFLLGGGWFWLGFAVLVSAQLLFDAFGIEDRTVPDAGRGRLENGALHASLPLHAVLTALLIYHLSDWDFLAIGTFSKAVLSHDLEAVRAAASTFNLLGAVFCTAVMCSAVSGSAGHELMHRVHNRIDVLCSRLLLAFCGYASFNIEHVYGHHRTVGTPDDPTTARRGTAFWTYFPRAVVLTNRNAFRFEASRMRKKGKPAWSSGNRALQGVALSCVIAAIFVVGAGWLGLAAYLSIALIGQGVIEQFNYVGHYGLVRVPGSPVMPRHSWNAFQLVSSSILFNLPRHSSHHTAPAKPYWLLEPEKDAPETPYGTTTMALIALAPPLWFRVIGPELQQWDVKLASDGERALLAKSAIYEFMT